MLNNEQCAREVTDPALKQECLDTAVSNAMTCVTVLFIVVYRMSDTRPRVLTVTIISLLLSYVDYELIAAQWSLVVG